MAIAFRRVAGGRLLAAIAVPVTVVAIYVWAAAPAGNPFTGTGMKTGYYDLLTNGFRAHHLYVAVDPVPELLALADPYDPVANARYRVHDMSLYRGKYYMYFGPVPVLTLFLPWREVTGHALGEEWSALIYVSAGYVLSVLLLSSLLRARGVPVRGLLWAAAAATLGLGEFGAVLLRDPGVYGVAIAAGYCFFVGGIYCFARLVQGEGNERKLAVAAGLSIGLAMGCRPHYALAAMVICPVYAWRLKGAWRQAAWLGGPIAVCGFLLLWYNFARFGDALEFGTSYQLTGSVATRGVSLHLRNLADGLYYLLLCPSHLSDQFPYVTPRFVAPNPRLFIENATGLLAISPLAAAGLALPLWIKRLHIAASGRVVLAALYAAASVVLVFISLTGFAAGRYLLDFAPSLLVISMFGWLWWGARTRWRRSAIAVIVAGSLWSAAMGTALCLGYNNELRDRNPRLFRRLARWSGQSSRSIRLPVEGLTLTAGVRFPMAGTDKERLLASGQPGMDDCVFVETMGLRAVRLGYAKAGVGTVLGPQITVEPDREYRLDVQYSGAAQRLIVSLDGAAVWDTPAAWYPTSQEEIRVGRGAVLRAPWRGSLSAAGRRVPFE